MELQTRLEVQGAVQQWAASFMAQYGIPAAMMEDALNKVIITLKEQVMIDLLTAATAPREEEEDGNTTESDNVD